MKKFLIVIFLGLLVRVIPIFFMNNLSQDFYWEYGELSKNGIHGNGYSLFYYNNSQLEFRYSKQFKHEPSAYMLPGYVAFLMPFLFVDNVVVRNIAIITL